MHLAEKKYALAGYRRKEETMGKWEGYVEKIVYRHPDNGYTVLQLSNEGDDDLCCVGYFSYVAEGQYLEVTGKEVVHKDYGPQIQMESFEEKQPQNALAMERYLGSGAIKGIGAALAARIVRKFGDDTFRVIEEEPERLAEVKGISQAIAIRVANQFQEKQQMRQAMLFLQDYGISMNMAVKIYKFYKDDIYEILRTDPYRLAQDIGGIGFKIADSIARHGGFEQDSPNRIRAGILYYLQQSGGQGHCYLPQQEMVAGASELLAVEPEQVEAQIDDMSLNKQILVREVEGVRCLYASTMYYMELNCARMLLDLNMDFPVKEEALRKKVRRIEQQEQVELDELQREAVLQAMQHGIMILMGGPGTGKTTTINMITKMFEEEGLEILLAAPTGRAAKRMSETTGYEAQTIHRLLEINGNPEGQDRQGMHFDRNELQPLEADVVIVDEMSMVDIYLMNALLKALVPGTRLILVGDANQLPSVGPGNVLKDMIQAGFCPVVHLTRIFRQAAKSSIVMNAHSINRGEPIVLDTRHRDFLHLERQDSQSVLAAMVELIMNRLPGNVAESPRDIQVLSPMRRGELGVENLNLVLQQYMNPPMPDRLDREFHGVLFREQDKVMQIRNNYQLHWTKRTPYGDIFEEGDGIFNGDCGVIEEISVPGECVRIRFDEDREVEYDFGDMDEIELAYAITIHKSQGSEYPAVVLPILGGPRMLFNRNLLYTAVTRAKNCVTIVGSRAMVQQMIDNVHEQRRYSTLGLRIREMQQEMNEG